MTVRQAAVGDGHTTPRPARTMWAGIHGRFSLHDPQEATDPLAADAYGLFVARSTGMQWLTDAILVAPQGLWGMNDAGQPSKFDDPYDPVAWFQVVLTDPPAARALLPIQPFLACAGDVIDRLGHLDLHAIQVLLPSPPDPTTSHEQGGLTGWDSLARAAGWFANCTPASRAVIEVSLQTVHSSELAPVISALSAPSIAPWQSTVVWDAIAEHNTGSPPVPQAIARELAGGPPRHLRLTGSLVEWSLDAAAWLAALLGLVAHEAGVDAPILLTITGRDERD